MPWEPFRMQTKYFLPATRPTGIFTTFELLKTPILKMNKKKFPFLSAYVDQLWFLWVRFQVSDLTFLACSC